MEHRQAESREQCHNSAPRGATRGSRSYVTSRNRGRAAALGNTPSLKCMSKKRTARPRLSLRIAALCALGALLLAAPAHAEQPLPRVKPGSAASLPDPAAAPPTTRIEVDEAAGMIRFFIEGRETMRLDPGGLRVLADIEYGGTLTDTGSAWIERQFGESGDGR